MDLGAWIVVFVLAVIYFVPTLQAESRGVLNKAPIFLVNLFFGWSVLGWIIALVMASGARTEKDEKRAAAQFRGATTSSSAGELKRCPDCAENVQPAAKVCRYCGLEFSTGRRRGGAAHGEG